MVKVWLAPPAVTVSPVEGLGHVERRRSRRWRRRRSSCRRRRHRTWPWRCCRPTASASVVGVDAVGHGDRGRGAGIEGGAGRSRWSGWAAAQVKLGAGDRATTSRRGSTRSADVDVVGLADAGVGDRDGEGLAGAAGGDRGESKVLVTSSDDVLLDGRQDGRGAGVVGAVRVGRAVGVDAWPCSTGPRRPRSSGRA